MAMFAGLRSWAGELTGYFIYLLLTGTLGPLLFGYHLAELNAPQEVITCVKKSIRPSGSQLPQCIPMDASQIGIVTSIFTLGGLFGALTAGPLTSRYGRLTPMRFTTAFFALGPVAEALAPSIAILAVGRFISGIGAGAALVIVPIYISEIAPPSQKGFFGAFTQIMTNTGIFITQVLGYFLSYGRMWRVILAIGGVIGVIQLAGLTFAVDSPRWKAENTGELKQARLDLRRIRGAKNDAEVEVEVADWKKAKDEDPAGSSPDEEIDEHEALLSADDLVIRQNSRPKFEHHGNMGTFEVFGHHIYRRATFAVMMVMVAQQFTGINSIIMYGVSLLSNLLQSNSALLNILVSLLNIVVTTACAPLADKWGRKACLLYSIAGMGISSILLGIGIRSSLKLLSAIAVLSYVASFGLGLGPVPFILASELVGPEAVGASQSWALAANWIATFVVALFFPLVNERLSPGMVYFVFAGLAVVFFTAVAWFVPETKGKRHVEDVWGVERRRERIRSIEEE